MKKCLTFTVCLTLCAYGANYKRSIPQKPKEKPTINAQSKTGFMLGFENAFLLHKHNNLKFNECSFRLKCRLQCIF